MTYITNAVITPDIAATPAMHPMDIPAIIAIDNPS